MYPLRRYPKNKNTLAKVWLHVGYLKGTRVGLFYGLNKKKCVNSYKHQVSKITIIWINLSEEQYDSKRVVRY